MNVSGKENVLCLAREEDRVWEVEITSSSGVATYEPLSKDGERVQVFPNPTSNMITIRDAGGEIFSASLYDALGREVVFARAMESGVCSMDVEALASGSYVLVCRLPGEVVTRRVNVLRR